MSAAAPPAANKPPVETVLVPSVTELLLVNVTTPSNVNCACAVKNAGTPVPPPLVASNTDHALDQYLFEAPISNVGGTNDQPEVNPEITPVEKLYPVADGVDGALA